jgi:hypothetical protein
LAPCPSFHLPRRSRACPPSLPRRPLPHTTYPASRINPKVARKFYKPADFPGVGRRCAFWEPRSKSWLWITSDRNATLPVQGGTYRLAALLDGRRSSGRVTVALADWGEREDFARPYATPPGNRNVSWTDVAATPAAACCGATGSSGGGGGGGGGGGAAAAKGDLSACPTFSAFG